MKIQTKRLVITEFDISMAADVHKNSLDDDNRRFLPDEVFEDVAEAKDTIEYLISVYKTGEGPLVYPVLLHNGTNIGHVQLVPIEHGYEVGYHIGSLYTKNGYATEALKAFINYIMREKDIDRVYAICITENIASIRVLEKCGFVKEYEGLGEYQGSIKSIAKYVFADSDNL